MQRQVLTRQFSDNQPWTYTYWAAGQFAYIAAAAILGRQQRSSACIDEVHSLMQSNRLPLNTNKSELLWCAIAQRHHQL